MSKLECELFKGQVFFFFLNQAYSAFPQSDGSSPIPRRTAFTPPRVASLGSDGPRYSEVVFTELLRIFS